MKKKIVLLNILLLALVFSSCNLFRDNAKMTFVNKSNEVISSIELKSYIGANTKGFVGFVDSLADGQTVSNNEKVTFDLPLLAPNTSLRVLVLFNNDDDLTAQNCEITYDAIVNPSFTLEYNGSTNDPVFSISGEGAELGNTDD